MRHHDLIVIGAGSGNGTLGESFADLDLAVVEQDRFGGTCLNFGCIPTKMFVLPADRIAEAREAARLGVHFDTPSVDWPAIRDRVFGRTDPISGHHAANRRNSGATVYAATARFVGERQLELSTGERLSADRMVVAVGSRPTMLPVPGLDTVDPAHGIHTSDTIMRLDALPARMVVVGGGFIACEFAHVFEAFGVEVTIVEATESLLPAEEPAVRSRVTEAMGERMPVHLGSTVSGARRDGQVWHLDVEGDAPGTLEAEVVLVAVGRTPNGDRLDAAAGGLRLDERGRVVVDGQQRTGVPGVWALGDVSTHFPLKHVANHEGKVAFHNIAVDLGRIGGPPRESDHRFVPHAVFTHPQVAAFGPTSAQLDAAGTAYVSATRPYASTAYGWALDDDHSFLTVHADPTTGSILAAHCVGPQASILIQPLLQAAQTGQSAREVATGQYWIHPALPEVVENALLDLPLD